VFDGRAVRDDDVELAIVVAINQPHAATHGFDDVLLIRSRNVGNGKACFARDLFELWQLRPEIAGKENKQDEDGPNHDVGSIIVRV
jgi:hypothetical protein